MVPWLVEEDGSGSESASQSEDETDEEDGAFVANAFPLKLPNSLEHKKKHTKIEELPQR